MSALGERFPVSQLRAEYKKQAHLGDVICPFVGCRAGETGGKVRTVSLRDEQGNVYVNIELEEKRG